MPRYGSKVQIARRAARQFGHVRWDQLRASGVAETTIRQWVRDGYLHPVLPRVYAVGHRPTSYESRLSAALLYAGPGAALSHGTAVHWWGLMDDAPSTISVSTPRNVGSQRSIRVHGRRQVERVERKGLAVTTPSQAIAHFAALARTERLRFVLANAEYQGLLDVERLSAFCGPGRQGSLKLRRALEHHRPELAFTRSELERELISLCESHALPMPKFNVPRGGWLVDAVWDQQRVVVEVDGWRGHHTPAQLHRDRQRELELRQAGYVVLRYSWHQLTDTPASVAADLRSYL